MIHNFAVRLAAIIAGELKMNERQGIIAYGLEVIIGALIKLILFVTLPVALGIFPQVAAAALASIIFRLAAGGAHCTAYYRCLVSSLVTFLAIGALARYLAAYSLPLQTIVICVTAWSLVIVWRWAPADTPAKPIVNLLHHKGLRIASLIIVAFYLVTGLYTPLKPDLVLAASLGFFIQAFTITPAGYRFIEAVDRLLSRQITPCRD
ncbi:MAG: accessory gene regulator B family protein [Bacillota bacterium]